MRLGKRIESLRKEKGWSLDILAEKTGISKSTLVDYEASDDGKISNLIKISSALDVSLESLMDENNIQFNNHNEAETVTQIQMNYNIHIHVQDANEGLKIIESVTNKK